MAKEEICFKDLDLVRFDIETPLFQTEEREVKTKRDQTV